MTRAAPRWISHWAVSSLVALSEKSATAGTPCSDIDSPGRPGCGRGCRRPHAAGSTRKMPSFARLLDPRRGQQNRRSGPMGRSTAAAYWRMSWKSTITLRTPQASTASSCPSERQSTCSRGSASPRSVRHAAVGCLLDAPDFPGGQGTPAASAGRPAPSRRPIVRWGGPARLASRFSTIA